MMEQALPVIWAAIIGIAVAAYVILDGFDLGIGILFPTTRTESERDRIMTSVAPFWDGNETWLVMGGVGLWVVFPLAYSIIMPAMYLPVMIMLLALVFRGVTFEFRTVARTSKSHWNVAFAAGSALAAFCQGLILGGLVQGVRVENGAFTGGHLDWLTPFGIVCGFGVATGYALLGATWLVMKTDGELQARSRRQAQLLLLAVLGFMAVVSLWTPLTNEHIAARWFSPSNIVFLWPVPVITGAVALACWLWLRRGHDTGPFFAAIALFLLGFGGLVISWFPYLVPPAVTVWDAAGAPESQMFMLVGTAVLLPIILGYTGFLYWVFRGKVREGDSYH
jgi:cytochrome d ubiquinol oxidase subunit II